MADTDTYLHLIGLEMLAILGITMALQSEKTAKRTLSGAFLLVLGILLAHFVSHILPDRFAHFVYGTHREYRSLLRQE